MEEGGAGGTDGLFSVSSEAWGWGSHICSAKGHGGLGTQDVRSLTTLTPNCCRTLLREWGSRIWGNFLCGGELFFTEKRRNALSNGNVPLAYQHWGIP